MINQETLEKKELQVGDTVHLNSGSPDLTVIALSGDAKHVAVEWADGMDVSRTVFSSASVHRIVERESSI